MFSRVTGTMLERSDQAVLIDVNGLAYEILTPPCVAEKLRDVDPASVTLEIYPSFTLEGNSGRFTFFGFTNAVEREFFEALISVASIGPKTGALLIPNLIGNALYKRVFYGNIPLSQLVGLGLLALLSLPDMIRGFGPVKDSARAKAAAKRTELLAALDKPVVTAMAAE